MATNYTIQFIDDEKAIIIVKPINYIVDCRFKSDMTNEERVSWLEHTANEVLLNKGYDITDSTPDADLEADDQTAITNAQGGSGFITWLKGLFN